MIDIISYIIIIILLLINIYIQVKEIKDTLLYANLPFYSLTIYAEVNSANKIVYKIKDNTIYYKKNRYNSKAISKLIFSDSRSILEFTSIEDAKKYIKSKLIDRIITIDKKIDIETIQIN